MPTKRRNFYSTVGSDTNMKPHDLYTALAIDAALLAVNDRLSELSDEQNQAVLDAAQTAAGAALQLAHVPNDWLDFLENLRSDRQAKLRDTVHDAIYENLPPRDGAMSEEQMAALARVRACTAPKKFADLEQAMGDLELAYAIEVNTVIEQAFNLGFRVATEPAALLYEKVGSA